MSKVQTLRAFVNQRLTAAAQEIFDVFERTIAEYEEELCRQHKLLDAVLKPDVWLHRAVSTDIQLLMVSKDEDPPEQQEWSPSLDQEDPTELPHIKEEQEELWTMQEGESTFTPVPVKSEEDDEEKPPSSQLHQSQSEEMKTEADGEDCGGPESDRNSDPDSPFQPDTDDKMSEFSEPETEDSCDWEETREPPSGLNPQQNDEAPVSEMQSKGKRFRCSVCKKAFQWKVEFVRHTRIHTGEKPFSCSVCARRFARSSTLTSHLRIHSGEKPYTCSVCRKHFGDRGTLFRHKTIHTGEKPFSCSVCGKTFARKETLRQHLTVHTGEKPFSCTICDKRFTRHHFFKKHKCIGENSGGK